MIQLKRLLNELNIQQKQSIGSGFEQTVYPSVVKPNTVIKKFTADEDMYSIEDWEDVIKTAKQHPDLFALVYKVDIDKRYFIQEKLDEKTLTKECLELSKYLFENNINIGSGDIFTFLYLQPNRINILDNTPWQSTLKPKIKNFFDRLHQAGYGPNKTFIGDIRLTNLGYDTSGKIKILDFNFESEYDWSGIDTPGDPNM